VVGLSQYFSSASAPELEQLSQTQDMSSQAAKRQRTSRGARTPVSSGVKNYVKGCMDRLLELKVANQTPVAFAAPGTAGTLSSVVLPSIQQGDTDATREGNIIRVKRVVFRAHCNDSTAGGHVRLILFIDRQANGTTPSVTDVLTSANWAALYNTNNVVGVGGSRFAILSDKTDAITLQIAATASFAPVYNRGYKMNMPVTYIANGGTAADVGKNAIWLLAIASNATAGFGWAAQLTYVDN